MSFLSRFILFGTVLLSACALPTERRAAIVPSASVTYGRRYGLVDVRQTIPDIAIDLRYATSHNVTRRPLYPANMPCLLRDSTAAKLKKAQGILSAQGYGLRIWDAWRPPEAQQLLYNHGAGTGMFLDPRVGWSRHCGGVAVDATLVDIEGRELRLPTYFDEDLHHASSYQQPSDPVIRQNLHILHQAMISAGFSPLEGEWWHFDDRDYVYRPIPVVNGRDIGVYIRGSSL